MRSSPWNGSPRCPGQWRAYASDSYAHDLWHRAACHLLRGSAHCGHRRQGLVNPGMCAAGRYRPGRLARASPVAGVALISVLAVGRVGRVIAALIVLRGVLALRPVGARCDRAGLVALIAGVRVINSGIAVTDRGVTAVVGVAVAAICTAVLVAGVVAAGVAGGQVTGGRGGVPAAIGLLCAGITGSVARGLGLRLTEVLVGRQRRADVTAVRVRDWWRRRGDRSRADRSGVVSVRRGRLRTSVRAALGGTWPPGAIRAAV